MKSERFALHSFSAKWNKEQRKRKVYVSIMVKIIPYYARRYDLTEYGFCLVTAITITVILLV